MAIVELGEYVLSQLLGDQNFVSLENDFVFNGKHISVRPEFSQVSG